MAERVTQAEHDRMIARIKKLISRYGGSNPVLDRVRALYGAFSRSPSLTALAVLKAEVEKVETLAAVKHDDADAEAPADRHPHR